MKINIGGSPEKGKKKKKDAMVAVRGHNPMGEVSVAAANEAGISFRVKLPGKAEMALSLSDCRGLADLLEAPVSYPDATASPLEWAEATMASDGEQRTFRVDAPGDRSRAVVVSESDAAELAGILRGWANAVRAALEAHPDMPEIVDE